MNELVFSSKKPIKIFKYKQKKGEIEMLVFWSAVIGIILMTLTAIYSIKLMSRKY
jgi:hypothetical protein